MIWALVVFVQLGLIAQQPSFVWPLTRIDIGPWGVCYVRLHSHYPLNFYKKSGYHLKDRQPDIYFGKWRKKRDHKWDHPSTDFESTQDFVGKLGSNPLGCFLFVIFSPQTIFRIRSLDLQAAHVRASPSIYVSIHQPTVGLTALCSGPLLSLSCSAVPRLPFNIYVIYIIATW